MDPTDAVLPPEAGSVVDTAGIQIDGLATDAPHSSPTPPQELRPVQIMHSFLASVTCYDMLTDSSKLVVFESEVPLIYAVYALLEHDIPSAPVWATASKCFIGLFSTSDVCSCLIRNAVDTDSGLFEATVTQGMVTTPHLVWVDAETSLLDAVKVMHEKSLMHLLVLAPDRTMALAVLSYRSIFEFMLRTLVATKEDFEVPLGALGIQAPLVLLPDSTSMLNVLQQMQDSQLECVAIVNASGSIVSLYSMSDIPDLLRDNPSKLMLPVGEVISAHTEVGVESHEQLQEGALNDTLFQAVQLLAQPKTARLLMADESNQPVFVSIEALLRLVAIATPLPASERATAGSTPLPPDRSSPAASIATPPSAS